MRGQDTTRKVADMCWKLTKQGRRDPKSMQHVQFMWEVWVLCVCEEDDKRRLDWIGWLGSDNEELCILD